MRVVIETISHADQRYDTCGDWWWEDDGQTLQMRVSDMGDWRKEMCVAYHEMFEALTCKVAGVTQEAVDAFDQAWVAPPDVDEPGDDVLAPYFTQHQQAMVAERHLANCLGVLWSHYERAVMGLSQDEG